MTWRTMESAPKDGTLIILYQPDGDGEDGDRTTAVGAWGEFSHGEMCWCMEAGDGWGAPTHWQPLLEPPGTPDPRDALIETLAEALERLTKAATKAHNDSVERGGWYGPLAGACGNADVALAAHAAWKGANGGQ